MSGRTGRWIWGMAVAWIAIGAALSAVVLVKQGQGEQRAPEERHRTVVVSDKLPMPASAPGGPLHALLLTGTVEAEPTVATVLSDENCQPDPQGYSHCLNRLEMPGGEVIEIQHTHRMSEVPCLSPGERVNVHSA